LLILIYIILSYLSSAAEKKVLDLVSQYIEQAYSETTEEEQTQG